MQNKKSVWSTIILVCTIITLILLVASIVVTSLGAPAIADAAKKAAVDQGLTPSEADLAATVAVGAIYAALVVGAIFDVFRIVGGFLFSLKGRWGIFCIVVSIISIASGVWSLVSDFTNHAAVSSIIINVVGLLVAVLYCIACFKHRAENNA